MERDEFFYIYIVVRIRIHLYIRTHIYIGISILLQSDICFTSPLTYPPRDTVYQIRFFP